MSDMSKLIEMLERADLRAERAELVSEQYRRENEALKLRVAQLQQRFGSGFQKCVAEVGEKRLSLIQSVKELRELTGCGLKEAKDAIEGYWNWKEIEYVGQ